MAADSAVLSLINQIYDAANDFSLWQIFLESLVRELDSSLAAFTIHDVGVQDGSIAAAANFDPAWQDAYAQHYAQQNVHIIDAHRKGLAVSGLPILGEMAIEDQQLVATEYYNDFLRPQKLRFLLGGLVCQEDSVMSLVSSHRSPSQGAFGERELRLMEILMPHLKRAVGFHSQMVRLRAQRDCVSKILEHTRTAFVVVSENGTILQSSRSAELILQAQDGLHQHCGQLRVWHSTSHHKLIRLVSWAARAQQDTLADTRHVSIPRPSFRKPYLISVACLRAQHALAVKERPAAIVFISDPEMPQNRSSEALRQCFGFTPAESGLALLLLQGKTLEEAADLLQVSRNTVRTQLRQLLAKTGTRRQSELISLLILMPE